MIASEGKWINKTLPSTCSCMLEDTDIEKEFHVINVIKELCK